MYSVHYLIPHLNLSTFPLRLTVDRGASSGHLSPDDYTVQIWSYSDDEAIPDLVNQGYDVIMSCADKWYFDCGMGLWAGEGHTW